MSFRYFSKAHRYQGPELMDESVRLGLKKVRMVYRNLTIANNLMFTYQPTIAYLTALFRQLPEDKIIKILDVGCGNGSKLRVIAKLAARMRRKVELIGIDKDPLAIQSAEQIKSPYVIRYLNQEIFEFGPDARFDVILSSNVLYHLKDNEIFSLLGYAKKHSTYLFINELYRSIGAMISWWFLCWTIFLPLGAIIRKDGFISISKGFRMKDWEKLIKPIDPSICIVRQWNFTWKVFTRL